MRMKTYGALPISALLLCTISACATVSGTGPAPPPPPPGSISVIEKNVITQICQPDDSINVVHINVDDINILNLKASHKHYKSDNHGNHHSGNEIRPRPKNEKFNTGHDTVLDFDATPYFGNYGYVLIEVELTQRNVYFTPGDKAITYGNKAGEEMFCVKQTMNAGTADKTQYFYVKYLKGTRYGAFSLSVDFVQGSNRITTVIDPNVKNEG